MRKTDIAIFFFIVAIVGWIIYKEVFRIAPSPREPITEKEGEILPEEKRVAKDLKISKEALEASRNSEIQQRLDQFSIFLAELEASLGSAQAKAIANPTDSEAKREAVIAETKTEQARAQLETRWQNALTEAVDQMDIAETAAIDATGAYQSALYRVNYWENERDKANEKIQALNKIQQGIVNDASLSNKYLEVIMDWRRNWEYYVRKIKETQAITDRVRIEAVATITNANFCVERVLTITADLRLLGILLALASRTDQIARATRNKLEDLEIRLRG